MHDGPIQFILQEESTFKIITNIPYFLRLEETELIGQDQDLNCLFHHLKCSKNHHVGKYYYSTTYLYDEVIELYCLEQASLSIF